IGDVGLARLVHQDAAGGTDPPGPAQVHHPPYHVEHVNAHVAHDAVAVFHERAPTPRVDQFVVGSERRRAGPQLVIEVFRLGDIRRIFPGAHMVVATDLDQGDLSEFALSEDLVAGLDEVWSAAALSADLHDALVAARGREHGLAFDDVHPDG